MKFLKKYLLTAAILCGIMSNHVHANHDENLDQILDEALLDLDDKVSYGQWAQPKPAEPKQVANVKTQTAVAAQAETPSKSLDVTALKKRIAPVTKRKLPSKKAFSKSCIAKPAVQPKAAPSVSAADNKHSKANLVSTSELPKPLENSTIKTADSLTIAPVPFVPPVVTLAPLVLAPVSVKNDDPNSLDTILDNALEELEPQQPNPAAPAQNFTQIAAQAADEAMNNINNYKAPSIVAPVPLVPATVTLQPLVMTPIASEQEKEFTFDISADKQREENRRNANQAPEQVNKAALACVNSPQPQAETFTTVQLPQNITVTPQPDNLRAHEIKPVVAQNVPAENTYELTPMPNIKQSWWERIKKAFAQNSALTASAAYFSKLYSYINLKLAGEQEISPTNGYQVTIAKTYNALKNKINRVARHFRTFTSTREQEIFTALGPVEEQLKNELNISAYRVAQAKLPREERVKWLIQQRNRHETTPQKPIGGLRRVVGGLRRVVKV